MAKTEVPHDHHHADKENMSSNSKDDAGPTTTSLQDVREAEISYLQSAILYQLVRSAPILFGMHRSIDFSLLSRSSIPQRSGTPTPARYHIPVSGPG